MRQEAPPVVRTLGNGLDARTSPLRGPRAMSLAGRGLFAAKDFPKIPRDDPITSFHGVFINGEENKELEQTGRRHCLSVAHDCLSVSHVEPRV
jgi:hypothetical protein